MEYLSSAFASILSSWYLVLIGAFIGILAGAIPGFSASNTLIIILPLTLNMQTEPALALMISIYCGAQLGGSVPAILFNVPGTGSAAVTCFDGHPMQQQGKGWKAIIIAYISSCLGGMLTTLITLFFLPALRKVVYYFGTVECFIVILFGIVLIAQLSSKSALKGAVSGLLGLLIGGIGFDHIYSTPRATFGLIQLYDGVPSIPAIIGLLAISEAIILAQKTRASGQEKLHGEYNDSLSETRDGIVTTLKNWITLIRSALIGYFVGIVPGAGASIGSFVSYQQALNLDPENRDSYGKGNPRGIIASEAANNGLCAGSIIPMIALGIPGGSTAAVMLIVLQSQGVALGPRLFISTPKMAYVVFSIMLVANLALLLIGIPTMKTLSRVVNLSATILVPSIISFTLIGAFSERKFIFDMLLALLFGVIGYIMKKRGFSVHACLLGIMLGSKAEQYFLRSLQLGSYKLSYFFSRPAGNVLWALLVLSLLIPPISAYVKKRKREKTT